MFLFWIIVGAIIALSSSLLALNMVKNLLRRVIPQITDKNIEIIRLILIVLGVRLGVWKGIESNISSQIIRSELEKTIEVLQESNRKVSEVQKKVGVQSLYSEVATWNASGTKWLGSIGVWTPARDWWKNYAKLENGNYKFMCTDDALLYYKKIINKITLYPFPYVVISSWLKGKNNISWTYYAEKALQHLQSTTQIVHHPDHDVYLKGIQEILSQVEEQDK